MTLQTSDQQASKYEPEEVLLYQSIDKPWPGRHIQFDLFAWINRGVRLCIGSPRKYGGLTETNAYLSRAEAIALRDALDEYIKAGEYE